VTKEEFSTLTLGDISELRKAIQKEDERADLERGQLRADLFNLHRDTKKKPSAFTADECRMYQVYKTEAEEAAEMEAAVLARLQSIQSAKRGGDSLGGVS
tara:strand:+ start:260 stop:559 length:300 start_codon:yes stop_codon:yes gene_type:complete